MSQSWNSPCHASGRPFRDETRPALWPLIHDLVPPFRPVQCYGRAASPLDGRGTRMIRLFGIALAALALFTAAAQAHPHVWVTMKSEVVYGADGVATGIRHAWTFDDMFSTYATQGLESKEKGKFTREELAALAQVNIESLKEFDYFTLANLNGKKTQLKPPVDYYLEFADGLLTLNFTLPLATPAKAQRLDFEMFDPTWFVDFSFAEKEPARLTGGPEGCKLT